MISLGAVGLFALGAVSDRFARVYDAIAEHLPGWEDEIVWGFVLLSLALGLFALLRWREVRRQVAARAAAEERYRQVVERIPAITYSSDPTKPAGTIRVRYVSPQVERILGFTPEEWTNDPQLWIRQIHPDDRERVLAASGHADRSGEPLSVEYRHLTKDGRVVWIREEAVAVERDPDGRPTLVQGVMYDITDRRRAEEQLREAEARYRMLVEQMPAVTYVADARDQANIVRYISPNIEGLLGFAQDEWLADPDIWNERLHPDDRQRVLAESRRTDETGDAFSMEYRMVAKGGRAVWIRDEAVVVEHGPTPGSSVWQGVFLDITRRKEAEQRLLEAEERYRTLVEQLPAITYVETGDSATTIYISPQIETMLGFTPDEWTTDTGLWERQLHPDDRERVLAEDAAPYVPGRVFSNEYRIYAKDGRLVWMHNEAVPVLDERGEPRLWQGVMIDITERRRAEQQLREAEERYRRLVEQLPVVVYQDAIDDVSTALYISPQYERLLGFSPEARLADPEFWIRQLHPDDRDWVVEESLRTNATGDPFVAEYRLLAKDGRVVWVRDEAVIVRGTDGRSLYWQGVLMDVTERRQAEATLARRDAILEAVAFAAEHLLQANDWADALPGVLKRLGAAAKTDRAYVFRNHRDAEGGLLMSQLAEWCAPDAVSTIDDPENTNYRYARGFARWEEELGAGRAVLGLRSNVPEAERIDMESEAILSIAAVPIFVGDEWWGFMGFDDCLTEREWPQVEIDALRAAADTLGAAIGRERAQRRQAETETRYRVLVEQIPAVTYIDRVDDVSSTIYVSPQLETMLGYTVDEWKADPNLWTRNLHTDDRERVTVAAGIHKTEGLPFDVEYRFRAADGTWKWVRDQATIVRDNAGPLRFSQGVMFDITESRLAEDQLRDTEAKYRAIVEHIPAVLYVDPADEHGRSLYVSPQAEAVLGISLERYLTEPEYWLELIHPLDRQRVLDGYRTALENREGWAVEYRVTRPIDGRVIWIRDESAFLAGGDGRPNLIQGVMFDVTERKLAEEALKESERREREAAERLRALDEMKNTFLAAVSHELRSPLTSILGLAVTLEQQDLQAEDRGDLLGRLAANARKLDRLLKDLLDIDRLNRGIVTPQYRPTDVGALVRRTVYTLDLPHDRSILVEVEPVLVPADPAKVERIVENLIVNAVRHTTSDRRVWVRVLPLEGGALIAVEDEGPGVPTDLQEAIFEPFRQGPTASRHSPGTGIGLSLVAMFADLHGGRAWVQEREGGGSSFRVFLPAVPPAQAGANGDGETDDARADRLDPAGAG